MPYGWISIHFESIIMEIGKDLKFNIISMKIMHHDCRHLNLPTGT